MYPSTTWELISSDKYLRTGSTALQIGGSNSISIEKENLPNVKLQVDTFSVTTQPHTHQLTQTGSDYYTHYGKNYIYHVNDIASYKNGMIDAIKEAGGENTGSASPSTETLGSGTSLSIQPTYITLKFWKRLS